MRKGDVVQVTYEGRTVEATVLLASSNGRSLFLEFDALLGGYAGTMPVLQDGTQPHRYRDLVTGRRVEVQPL